jgi:hypothetical protein
VAEFKAVEKSVGSGAEGQSARITWFMPVYAVLAQQIGQTLHYISVFSRRCTGDQLIHDQ